MVDLPPSLVKRLERIKTLGKNVLEKREEYLATREDSAAFIVGSDLTILECEGKALKNLNHPIKETLRRTFDGLLYPIDRRNLYGAIDALALTRENSFYMGAGIRLGSSSVFSHYELSGRVIRDDDSFKNQNRIIQEAMGYSLLIRTTEHDWASYPEAVQFPPSNQPSESANEKQLIRQLQEALKNSKKDKPFVIDLTVIKRALGEEPSDNLIGLIGSIFVNNKYVNLRGVRILSPYNYTLIRNVAYLSGRHSPKDMGLRGLSTQDTNKK